MKVGKKINNIKQILHIFKPVHLFFYFDPASVFSTEICAFLSQRKEQTKTKQKHIRKTICSEHKQTMERFSKLKSVTKHLPFNKNDMKCSSFLGYAYEKYN